MRQLSDYLQTMQTADVLTATEKAKAQARVSLEDQGITMLALLLADFLGDALGQGMLGQFSSASKSTIRSTRRKQAKKPSSVTAG